jgi:regulator of RNase E activity RraA
LDRNFRLFAALKETGSNSGPPSEITLPMVREALFTAVVCDALDSLGCRNQAVQLSLTPVLTGMPLLAGRCRTTLWVDMYHSDPRPYELELRAVDSCGPDEIFVCAAQGSLRSGIWGELLATASRARGAVGAVIDGAVRDVARLRAMQFPVFARGTSPFDSKDRQRVVDIDVPVEIGGAHFRPRDLVLADEDGIVVVPREVEREALRIAWEKVHTETEFRRAVGSGLPAAEAFRRYGVL